MLPLEHSAILLTCISDNWYSFLSGRAAKDRFYCIISSQYTYEPRSDRRDLLAIKVQIEIFTEKERAGCCEKLQKFEKIIFTNNKDMSI